jgi:NAD(P)-dependent dehydrogenase (short-subunit alcohol dehydrogenase family)
VRDLRGRVAVITGAASGIGFGMARRFAAEGMKLVLADVEVPALEHARLALERAGATVSTVHTDVSSATQVERLAEGAYATYGAVHLLCNNAGVSCHRRLWEQTEQEWAWVLGVNLWGVIHGIRSFVPRMIAAGDERHIVNTASSQSFRAGSDAYSVSKHAVAALSEGLFRQLRASGAKIGVTVICPGPVKTNLPSSRRNRPSGVAEEMTPFEVEYQAWARGVIADGREPVELAGLVVDWVQTEQFWGIPAWIDDQAIRARCESMVRREPPGP